MKLKKNANAQLSHLNLETDLCRSNRLKSKQEPQRTNNSYLICSYTTTIASPALILAVKDVKMRIEKFICYVETAE